MIWLNTFQAGEFCRKRFFRGILMELAARTNAPEESGYRLLPLPGEVFTEIDAIRQLTGTKVEMLAAGGADGAEGAVLLALRGSPEQLARAGKLISEISGEKYFKM
jgi:hypothetical protein